jgi:LuxR family transcriptional regulator, maltose regulon positive regulatory protein
LDTGSEPARAGPEVLVETKLYAPPARREWVQRTELIRGLAGRTAKLVLVAAPAGFGKSTLVSQWGASTGETRPFAWISLDSGDDDPGRLWWHLACAVQRACPGFRAEEVLRALRAQVPDFAGVVLPLIVNQLAALPEPVVLVLDDYHVIEARSCHEQVAFLLTHLPPSAQLVIITRTDPPLGLARMRAVGEMTEVRAADLRFGPAATAALVRAVAGVALSDADVASLVQRTEGWPAGVYLAALSLRGHTSPSSFVRQFGGENRFIIDFLAEEVLTQQPAEVRRFLARTSILTRFCAPLCDAVAGAADSAGIISVMERENLFVVPLDQNRRWFRYHNLFAEVLHSQLAATEPDCLAALHERASAWHQVWGSAEEAIRHSLAAGDAEGAIGLIAEHWHSYVDSGRMATVSGWLDALGDARIAASPLAAHSAMWIGALSGDQRSTRRWLSVVAAAGEQGPLPDGMRSYAFSAAVMQASFGFDGIGAARRAGAVAVRLETDPMSPWYSLARTAYAADLYFSGQPELAAAQLDEADQASASLALARMLAAAVAAWLAVDAGQLAEADTAARRARDIVTDPVIGLSGAPQTSLAYIATGAVLAARGQLDEARGEFETALRIRRKWAGISPVPTIELLLRYTPVLADLGDHDGAAALVAETRELLEALPDGAEAQLARLDALERRVGDRPRLNGHGQNGLSPWSGPAEPLTGREQAVLRLLTGTLSLREIANVMYVSPNTVKTHTQAVYRKLGVSDRKDAVARGRDLGLL